MNKSKEDDVKKDVGAGSLKPVVRLGKKKASSFFPLILQGTGNISGQCPLGLRVKEQLLAHSQRFFSSFIDFFVEYTSGEAEGSGVALGLLRDISSTRMRQRREEAEIVLRNCTAISDIRLEIARFFLESCKIEVILRECTTIPR